MRRASTAATWVADTPADLELKLCQTCGCTRPPAAYFPCRASLSGITDRCRDCILAAARQDREARERRAAARIGGAA